MSSSFARQDEMLHKAKGSQMSGILGPQQVVMITTRAESDEFGKRVMKDDIDVTTWHMPVSHTEKVFAISLHKAKHITKLIGSSGIFVVNFLPFGLSDKARMCLTIHGQHIDKFTELDLTRQEASHLECPCIKEACAYLECTVRQRIEFEDHVLFIANIINSRLAYDVKRLFHISEYHYSTTKDDEV